MSEYSYVTVWVAPQHQKVTDQAFEEEALTPDMWKPRDRLPDGRWPENSHCNYTLESPGGFEGLLPVFNNLQAKKISFEAYDDGVSGEWGPEQVAYDADQEVIAYRPCNDGTPVITLSIWNKAKATDDPIAAIDGQFSGDPAKWL